jgi:hypothetical protein
MWHKHNVVCSRMRCSVTTISRGRNRLWPSGLQYNARRMQIAWPVCESRRSLQPITPWNHNTLIVLREDNVRSGDLNDVWRKIHATQQAGKRVLLVLQDPKTEDKKHSRTQEFFRNIHGTVVAWFPTGTILFGHACGWPDSHTFWKGNSHSWILKDGNQIRPPTDVHQHCMQRHANLMNTSPVRFILFPAHNDSTQKIFDIDKLKLRRLAYLIGGIGYIQFQKSIA